MFCVSLALQQIRYMVTKCFVAIALNYFVDNYVRRKTLSSPILSPNVCHLRIIFAGPKLVLK